MCVRPFVVEEDIYMWFLDAACVSVQLYFLAALPPASCQAVVTSTISYGASLHSLTVLATVVSLCLSHSISICTSHILLLTCRIPKHQFWCHVLSLPPSLPSLWMTLLFFFHGFLLPFLPYFPITLLPLLNMLYAADSAGLISPVRACQLCQGCG